MFEKIKNKAWYETFRRAFWSNPDRLMAIKTSIVIGVLSIPFILLGRPFFAVTLGLGALAGSLSETDDHPKGRIKSMLLKVFSFGIASFLVQYFYGNPYLLGVWLAVSSIILVLIGGTSERYRGVSFGTLLVSIYAMIGAENSPNIYIQPLLLTIGALAFGVFSLILLYFKPWRLLEEQLARGFMALSTYYEEKARLFPSDEGTQKEIRTRLSALNVQTVNALDSCRDVFNSYGDALKDHTPLKPYLHYFMVLQSLHERAASSHDKYDLLSNDPQHKALLDGIGQAIHQLAHATKRFAQSLLTNIPYEHPTSLIWMSNALTEQLSHYEVEAMHPLELLIDNLKQSNNSLKNIHKNSYSSLVPKLKKDERSFKQRIKDQLTIKNSRMRYALRLSVALVMSVLVSELFDMEKGGWIALTVLVVLQPNYSATRKRFGERILGTVSGVFLGIIAVNLFSVSGQVLFMIVSAYLFTLLTKRNYSASVVFITTFVLFAFNLINQRGIEMMWPRFTDTIVGAVFAFLSVRILWPDWQSKNIPMLLKTAIEKNTNYFKVILEEYRNPTVGDDLEYRIARRQAHRADNALVTTWQNIQVEPKKQQLFRKNAFRLTYLNHALLSYLSALGAHRDKPTFREEFMLFAETLLELLSSASDKLKGQHENDTIRISKLLKDIKKGVEENYKESDRQQMILLYNIAEVTIQLLDEAQVFNKNFEAKI